MQKFKLISHVDKVMRQIQSNNKRNIRDATMTAFGSVRRMMTGARTGERYNIPGSSSKYTASAPGEAPAKRTGALDASIRYKVDDSRGAVGTDNQYAAALEFGTEKIKPRKFLQPGFQRAAADIRRILSRIL